MSKKVSFGIEVKKPISVLSRDLNISPKTFFTNLAKATINGVKGDLDDCAENLIDSVVDIKAEEKVGQLAWVLIYQSIQNAISELISDSIDLLNCDPKLNLSSIESELETLIEETFKTELVISSDFLTKPEALSIIENFSCLVESYCIQFGASKIDAKSIASKLPNKFALSVYNLWLESSGKFQKLVDTLESPLSKNNNVFRRWQIYHQSLHVGLEKRLFKESFGLHDIYVKPRAFFNAPKSNDLLELGAKDMRLVQHVVELHSYLKNWLLNQDTSDNLKLISGNPGSGKSSFSKCFASEISKETGYNVLLIQLHLLDMSKDLNMAIKGYCDEYKTLRGLDVLSSEKLLILFDGLDEISMQGKIGATVSNNFISELKRKSELLSQDKRNVKFIVTGRDLSIQSCESVVKETKKYLNIVPYHIPKRSIPKNFDNLYDPKGLMEIDQRHIWWKKFSSLKGFEWKSMPKELCSYELEPISSQPLLGYLLALSFLRGQINFSNSPNLNTIYKDLLDSVFERQYASDEGSYPKTHKSISMLSGDDFDLLMQEVALAVWHCNGTTATESFIYEHLRANELEHLLDQFKNESGNGVSSLLLSFYFRKHGQTEKGESTFEFTHKSFGEYLTSKKIVNLVIDLSEAYTEKKKNNRKGKKLEDITQEWIRATGVSTFETYLYPFVQNELINLKLSEQKLHEVHTFLTAMLNDSIQNNYALEKFSKLSFQQMIFYSENSNLALLALHSACSNLFFLDSTRRLNSIQQLSNEEAKNVSNWLDRNLTTNTFNYYFEYMNFSNVYLYFKDFRLSEINNSDFRGATIENSSFYGATAIRVHMLSCEITESNFVEAELSNSNFTGSIFHDVDFSDSILFLAKMVDCHFDKVKFIQSDLKGSDLSFSNFKEVNCDGAYFIGSNLQNVLLIDASLVEANFTDACLLGGNFSGANLRDAILENATLKGAKLKGANLKGATLKGVDLTGVNLIGVDLTGADLTGVDLTGADLTGVDLTGVDLTGADLTGADLTGADLTGVDFTGVDLTGVDFTGVDLTGATIPLFSSLVYN